MDGGLDLCHVGLCLASAFIGCGGGEPEFIIVNKVGEFVKVC